MVGTWEERAKGTASAKAWRRDEGRDFELFTIHPPTVPRTALGT